jgi:hypothetical protein
MGCKFLRFKYKPKTGLIEGMREGWKIFFPNGQRVLNKTEWRGKEPRSCCITNYSSPPTSGGTDPVFDVEVTYRPKGYISYTGKTRYDGWTAMVLTTPDEALQGGQEPNYVPREVYGEADFNSIDFGEFVGEFDTVDVKQTTADVVFDELNRSGHFSSNAGFMAPHRSRPSAKISLSDNAAGLYPDGFGGRIVNINLQTDGLPNLFVTLWKERWT